METVFPRGLFVIVLIAATATISCNHSSVPDIITIGIYPEKRPGWVGSVDNDLWERNITIWGSREKDNLNIQRGDRNIQREIKVNQAMCCIRKEKCCFPLDSMELKNGYYFHKYPLDRQHCIKIGGEKGVCMSIWIKHKCISLYQLDEKDSRKMFEKLFNDKITPEIKSDMVTPTQKKIIIDAARKGLGELCGTAINYGIEMHIEIEIKEKWLLEDDVDSYRDDNVR